MTGTIGALLELRARTHEDEVFLRFDEAGNEVTFAETEALVGRLAGGLADTSSGCGLRSGDRVAMLLPNRPEFPLAWFALSRLGAVAAPVNTAFRGTVLQHALNLAGARVAVVDAEFLHALETIADRLTFLEVLVVCGDAEGCQTRFPRWRIMSFADLDGEPIAQSASVAESDPAIVLFTSGTTGRSKGCVLSHRYALRQGELLIEHLRLRPTDVLFCPFPLFHLDASVLTLMPALILGTTAALVDGFSASRFWEQIRETGATVFDFMGATLTILHKQPTSPDDAKTSARLGWGVPLPEYAPEFESRFGIELVELYGSTDVGIPIYSPLGDGRRRGSCGLPIEPYEVRLVDEGDQEVPVGVVGEIVVRPREPSLMMDGYLGMAEETLGAMRNLWFHTGDLASRDADGYIFFAGRNKDVIRRRGENISAFEVEEVIDTHPSVLEAAAFGVPSELTEEEVMVALVLRPGASIDLLEFVGFCARNMAQYMVPRFVEIVDALPKTPTEKVEKFVLAERGVTAATWDRLA